MIPTRLRPALSGLSRPAGVSRAIALLFATLLTAVPAPAQEAGAPIQTEPQTQAPAPVTPTPAATMPAPAPAASSTTPPAETPPAGVAPRIIAPATPIVPGASSTDQPPAGTVPAQPSSPTAPALAPTPAPAAGMAPAASPADAVPGGVDVSPLPVPEDANQAETIIEAPEDAPAATLPHDLSPWGMFMAADYVVKAVMIGLAFASLVTWTIWLAKAMELGLAKSRARRGVRRLENAASLADVASTARGAKWPRRGPVAALVAAAEGEIVRSGDMAIDGVKERTQVALQRIEARAGRSMARGTGLLATIGSTAPFVGLFGTVWGIMNAFIGISQANTTNLAVVAPGIAEALLATAIGLVAAIPAVIIYNVFARSIAGYRAVLADASAEVLRHLSRDLDRREHARPAAGRLQAAE